MRPGDDRRGDRGIGLVEVLVAMGLLVVIGGAVMTTIVSGFRAEARQVEQVQTLNAAKTALERLTRDLRGANPLSVAEPLRVQLRLSDGVVRRTLTYTATPHATRGRIDLLEVRRDLATGVEQTRTTQVLAGLQLPVGAAIFSFAAADGTALAPVSASPVSYSATAARLVTIRLRVHREQGAGGAADLYQRISLRNTEG